MDSGSLGASVVEIILLVGGIRSVEEKKEL